MTNPIVADAREQFTEILAANYRTGPLQECIRAVALCDSVIAKANPRHSRKIRPRERSLKSLFDLANVVQQGIADCWVTVTKILRTTTARMRGMHVRVRGYDDLNWKMIVGAVHAFPPFRNLREIVDVDVLNRFASRMPLNAARPLSKPCISVHNKTANRGRSLASPSPGIGETHGTPIHWATSLWLYRASLHLEFHALRWRRDWSVGGHYGPVGATNSLELASTPAVGGISRYLRRLRRIRQL